RSFWPLVAPLSDEGALPAASSRRHVGQGVVVFAVGLFGNWIAAEIKIRVPRIAARPAAAPWGKRDDLLGGGETLSRQRWLPRRAPRGPVAGPAPPGGGRGGAGWAAPFSGGGWGGGAPAARPPRA